MPSIEENLGRIADALERIAGAIAPATPVVVDGVEHIPTLTAPPLAWFSAPPHHTRLSDENQPNLAENDDLTPEITRNSNTRRNQGGQTTWDWLGVLCDTDEPAPDLADLDRHEFGAVQVLQVTEEQRQEMRDHWATLERRAERGRRRRGKPLKCGRCRREGRSRMNHSDRCIECKDEDWWDE